jgi:hypothetical protein
MNQEILGGIVIAMVAALVGWGVSQLTTGRKVSEALAEFKITMEHINNDHHRTKDEMAALRLESNSRILSLETLVEKVIDQSASLIKIVELQNALLQQKKNQ